MICQILGAKSKFSFDLVVWLLFATLGTLPAYGQIPTSISHIQDVLADGAASISPADSLDKQMLYIPWPDGWELVKNNDNGKRADLQFYQKGENPSNWSEAGLISAIYNKRLANLEEFMYDNNSVLLTNCGQQQHKLIKHQPTGPAPYIVYSFSYADCGKSTDGATKQPTRPQSWLCIVVQGAKHLFIAQYGIKQDQYGPMPASIQNQWVKILAKGRLINMPE
jgi:hypothetical protein